MFRETVVHWQQDRLLKVKVSKEILEQIHSVYLDEIHESIHINKQIIDVISNLLMKQIFYNYRLKRSPFALQHFHYEISNSNQITTTYKSISIEQINEKRDNCRHSYRFDSWISHISNFINWHAKCKWTQIISNVIRII